MSTGHPNPGGLPFGQSGGYEPVPGWPDFDAPSYPPGAPAISDHDLRQLPPPVATSAPVSPTAVGSAEPRPGVVAVAASLAVTASLLWVCALSLAWVTATVGAADLGQQGEEGAVFHILNRFHYRMIEGLAWPLYGFPTASLVTGFALLSGRSWARITHSAIGAAAVIWSAWWLRDALAWWVSPAAYVAIACLVLWTPAANRWFARSAAPPTR